MNTVRTTAPPRTALAPAMVLLVGLLLALLAAQLILREWGLLTLLGLALLFCFGLILLRWQRGYYGLLAYLPFSGAVTLAFYPWEGPPFAHPLLYKDIFFALPAYLGFLGARVLRRTALPDFARAPALCMLLFGLLVLLQAIRPAATSPLLAAIGIKVWLFYMPLYLLTAALLADLDRLRTLLRTCVVLAVVPCLVGLAQYLLGRIYGHQVVMETIYGVAAAHVTQEFTVFEVGGGYLAPRIPATFSSVTQYFAYTLAMLVPCYILSRSDPAPRWRRMGRWMLALVAVASLLSGARAAFVFVPLLLVLAYGFDRGFGGLPRALLVFALVLALALGILSVPASSLFAHIWELLVTYAEQTAYLDLLQAIERSPFGGGTGTNTGPARHALDDPEAFVAVENYYAKAVLELGWIGLLLLWWLFAALMAAAWRARQRLRSPLLRTTACAVLAFLLVMALNCFKGWLMDLDPINVYFWVFAGIAGRLAAVSDSEDSPATAATSKTVPELP